MAEFHSRVSPSGLADALACPARPDVVAAAPRSSSQDADLGTDFHELMAAAVVAGVPPDHFAGHRLKNGNTVDAEMVGHASRAWDYVSRLPGRLFVETRVDLTPWFGEPASGTPDLVSVEGTQIHLVDYKYGARHFVDVEDNAQLKAYALGALDAYDPDGFLDDVHLHIVQPRMNNLASWWISAAALREWGETVVKPGLARTREPNPPRVPGPSQCLWCPAKGTCTALAVHASEAVFLGFGEDEAPSAPAPASLTPDQIARVLARADLIKTWLTAVKSDALARLKAGQEIPGFKPVRGRRGDREWNPTQIGSLVSVLTQDLGLDQASIYKIDLLSPAKILSLPDVRPRADLLAPFVVQAEGEITIAPVTDKRPAVPLDTPAEIVFAEFKEI